MGTEWIIKFKWMWLRMQLHSTIAPNKISREVAMPWSRRSPNLFIAKKYYLPGNELSAKQMAKNSSLLKRVYRWFVLRPLSLRIDTQNVDSCFQVPLPTSTRSDAICMVFSSSFGVNFMISPTRFVSPSHMCDIPTILSGPRITNAWHACPIVPW